MSIFRICAAKTSFPCYRKPYRCLLWVTPAVPNVYCYYTFAAVALKVVHRPIFFKTGVNDRLLYIVVVKPRGERGKKQRHGSRVSLLETCFCHTPYMFRRSVRYYTRRWSTINVFVVLRVVYVAFFVILEKKNTCRRKWNVMDKRGRPPRKDQVYARLCICIYLCM